MLGGLAALAGLPATADAASVSYIDGGEVWVSTLDGSSKAQLSSGGPFKEVARSDAGHTVGIRRDGRSELSTFTVWDPSGAVSHSGPLLYEVGLWTARAYPLSLDITADGGSITYGYSNSYYDASRFPAPYVFGSGAMLVASTNVASFQQTVFAPQKQEGRRWPTFVGRRLVTQSGGSVLLQRAGDGVPYANDHDPWFSPTMPAGYDLHRTDVAANASSAAWERTYDSGGVSDAKIDVAPLRSGFAAGPDEAAGCTIPAQGKASDVSISPDGTAIAWKDDGGVKVAGIPNFSGVNDCAFTSPPVVISPTASYPSIGGGDVPSGPVGGGSGAGAPPSPSGSGSGSGGPTPQSTPPASPKLLLPAKFTARGLRGGVTVSVAVSQPGPVDVQVLVPSSKLRAAKTTVIARGKTTAKTAGTVRVKLRATRKARAKLRRLKGVTASVKVVVGTTTTTKRVKLG